MSAVPLTIRMGDDGLPGDPTGTGDGSAPDLAGRVLDLFVFAPVGVVESLVRWVPRAITVGRQRTEQQVRTARWIGEMAVGVGRQRLAQRFGASSAAPSSTSGGSMPTASTAPSPAPAPAPAPSSAVDDEPFAGYDSLPAAELVGMLARLSRAELEAVRRYEAGARGRRTVLARLDQLLAA
ncbi:MAG: hypothetical protein ACO3C1_04945 [Ilumatobacteraceae bacterium]